MPVALTGGYVDTGISVTLSFTCTVQLKDLQAFGPAHVLYLRVNNAVGPDEYRLYKDNFASSPCFVPPDFTTPGSQWQWNISVSGPGMTTTIKESQVFGTCHPLGTSFHSGVYSFTYTAGPFRLGVRHALHGASANPNFSQRDYALYYHWFSDEATVINCTMAGVSATQRYWLNGSTTAPAAATRDEGQYIGELQFGCELNTTIGAGDYARWNDITLNGNLIDTSELNTSVLVGLGGGDVKATGSNDSESAKPPVRLIYNLDVIKETDPTADSTGARLLDGWLTTQQLHSDLTQKTPHLDYITVPYGRTAQVDHSIPISSWETHKKVPPDYLQLTIQSAWAADQSPPFRADDLYVALWGVPGLSSPGPALPYTPGSYTHPFYSPITMQLASSIDVHRPDGNTPSSFVTSDAGKLTVTEGATTTTITVTATGANARRALVSSWRTWGNTNYQTTDHNAHGATVQDVWGWESYAYLRLAINAPSAGTLTLTIEGVHLNVSDNHETTRVVTFAETAYTKTYSVVLASGANTVDVDLLFPTEGGPWYHGRIDAIKLEGFATGTYTISEIKLISKVDPATSTLGGTVYAKWDCGPPVQRDDYDALGISHNGAFPMGAMPDEANKTEKGDVDHSWLYGGYLRYVDIITRTGTGAIEDAQLTLEAFWNQLGGMEGWTVTYSVSAYRAANRDSYLVQLEPELAQWSRPALPHDLQTAGTNDTVPCNPMVSRIYPPNLQNLMLYTRSTAGHACLEALVETDAGARAGSGVTISAKRTDTGAVAQSDSTDAFGYVVVSPIPADGVRAYELAQG